ncbi:MAG: endonuclease III domain-containing protein [Syntrophales bacterium]|nr:endonuclease III domain-containing protein [Syntrophales bacterium]
MMAVQEMLGELYEGLNAYFGDLRWWPGETPFEITVGAILTQNTNWKNVEAAIGKLKKAGLLDPLKLYGTGDSIIAGLIRSSGYYNIKTKRLKAFLDFLHNEYAGDLDAMFNEGLCTLREKLLGVRGIGAETADSILLYAGGKPVFVVDAYTRRVLERHDLITPDWSYHEVQALFMDSLPHDTPLYNQYHALFVQVGKQFCKKQPHCDGCPLENGLTA